MCLWLTVPQETLLSDCVTHHFKPSSFLTFYHTSLFSILLSFSFLLLSRHTVAEDTLFFYSFFRYLTPTLFSFPLVSSPSLPAVLFSLMDDANAYHQQCPSGGDSFLPLLTEGHNRPAEIIHSFIPSNYEFIQLSSIATITHSFILFGLVHTFFYHWLIDYIITENI